MDDSEEMAPGNGATEMLAVAEFLRGSLPFNELDDADLNRMVACLRASYQPRGARFESAEAPAGLRVLRSGAVDIRDADNKLLDRLGEGESFSIAGLNTEQKNVVATVIEDALIYRLPESDYQALRRSHRAVDRYFTGQRSRRLRRAARYQAEPNAMAAELATVMAKDLLTIAPEATVQAAAAAMAARRVSSTFVVDQGKLRGILTDRDLRVRVLAAGVSPSVAVSEVMTPQPRSIDAGQSIFAATLMMTQSGIHHLPVTRDGELAGVVTTSDLIVARQDDPVYLVQRISRQQDVDGIRQLVAGISNLMVQWFSSGMSAQQISQILTAISDAIAVRLIQLAEAELGPAPKPWAWIGFGSQARAEQLLGADQDNGIVIDDNVEPGELDWYSKLATRVSDGLAMCGYKYCPGEIMATTESWRQPLATWQSTVRRWARAPTNDAVMRVSIFFDLRCLYGEADLVARLQKVMLEQASSNTIFLAALAANVLDTRPPLGIFRRFVVDRNGDHRDSLDIKKRGILPVTEIARLHALAHSLPAVNTEERLAGLAKQGFMTMADSRNLADALHFIQGVRIRHQCDQVMAGAPVDNYVNPRTLPRLAREQLRDAFTIIDEAQSAIRQTYRAGMG
ncbi:cyclic nucleotide-binding protein [Luminiphilus syltensis NOR5-1B]|uniref:Cyclic nucleotide-binding protein n=1 Tax=Luminiphilus syltensis NOR5-1B TaxID=565045 RepID=B8KS23_9GAMM|nr:putative nucleotidyltransferase substrate binding domain-containing protein [Luminiphilus syltensis]EED35514.1 cyclic nucleotide-binding protein [Luminiphilus syltensis NOR5-1B]